MTDLPRGWLLLHSKLPSAAIKPLATAVYGVAGLSDVNEGFLIQRLFASELVWEWKIVKQEYLGFEDRTNQAGNPYRVYLAAVQGELTVDFRSFHGSGASDNRKLDAAFKGAATVAFKNACKVAGLTAELYLDGRAMDHIYSERIPKDKEMTHASVDELVAQIEDAFGAPEEAVQGERSESPGRRVVPSPIDSAMTLEPSLQETSDGRGAAVPNAAAVPTERDPAPSLPSVSPDIPDADDRQPLYFLARTLKAPKTAVLVDDMIAKHGIGAVRLQLIMAHARDHGMGCVHVAEVSGLLVGSGEK